MVHNNISNNFAWRIHTNLGLLLTLLRPNP